VLSPVSVAGFDVGGSALRTVGVDLLLVSFSFGKKGPCPLRKALLSERLAFMSLGNELTSASGFILSYVSVVKPFPACTQLFIVDLLPTCAKLLSTSMVKTRNSPLLSSTVIDPQSIMMTQPFIIVLDHCDCEVHSTTDLADSF
jgi:hypothetical protein